MRYEKKTPTCFKPERFCVAKEYRGKGLGGQLLEAAEKRAVSEGCQTSYVVAEMTAVDFYEKQGIILAQNLLLKMKYFVSE